MNLKKTDNLRYSCTNENLEAIVSALRPSEEDNILSVGSSGDQAFAFLEFGSQVTVVDNSEEQTEFIDKRIVALSKGDYQEFLVASLKKANKFFEQFNRNRRGKYFEGKKPNSENGSIRLRKIRKNLANITLLPPQNILEIAQTRKNFNKIYLSNVIGYWDDKSYHEITPILRNIARNLPEGGLIYIANHSNFIKDKKMSPLFLEYNHDLQDSSFLPEELTLESELSLKARKHEIGLWRPAVYRKT